MLIILTRYLSRTDFISIKTLLSILYMCIVSKILKHLNQLTNELLQKFIVKKNQKKLSDSLTLLKSYTKFASDLN